MTEEKIKSYQQLNEAIRKHYEEHPEEKEFGYKMAMACCDKEYKYHDEEWQKKVDRMQLECLDFIPENEK